jgi:UDP-glucuronate 4-epimerase
MSKLNILVTGSAGFIGYHLVSKLLDANYNIVGLDNINNYYSTKLKEDRLASHGIIIDNSNQRNEFRYESEKYLNYKFYRCDISNIQLLNEIFDIHNFDVVVNLAAQAGVRYSLENPFAYIDSNINGFMTILELSKKYKIKHLLYASTSSVYGLNSKLPFDENDLSDHPLTIYAATKRANELMAHSYSHLFQLPTTAMRFFTVYGPWGRPDMALFEFTKLILEGKPINLYNFGRMTRDFTFVEDVVESINRLIPNVPKINSEWDTYNPDISASSAPFRIVNIGNGNPVDLILYVEALQNALNKKAVINLLPLQKGDVLDTFASIEKLKKITDYKPKTTVDIGVNAFVDWYKNYFKK